MLADNEVQSLNWTRSNFNYPNIVRIGTIGDGSCFFHAVVKAFYTPYKIGILNGIPIDKRAFIQNLRKDLAIKLVQKVDPLNKNSPRYYDLLGRGKLKEFSKEMPEYTIENMQRVLNSNLPVDNSFNEFVSNLLNKDIYLLDYLNKDVYITGKDDDILYKGRDSIVILVMPGHYELIGLMTVNGIQTLFPSDHTLIQVINQRRFEKLS